jgi:hypothetical protein
LVLGEGRYVVVRSRGLSMDSYRKL